MKTLTQVKFYNWCTPECAKHVKLRNLVSIGETAQYVQEYQSVNRERRPTTWHKPGNCGGEPRRSDGPRRNEEQRHGSDKQHRDYLRHERPQWHRSEWQPTCFKCGIKGHKSINFPEEYEYDRRKNTSAGEASHCIYTRTIQGRRGESRSCRVLYVSGQWR